MLRSVVRVDTISGLPADVSPPEATSDDDGVLVDDVDAEAGVRVLVDHVEEGREGRAACMLRSVVRVDTISGLPADVSPPEATSSS